VYVTTINPGQIENDPRKHILGLLFLFLAHLGDENLASLLPSTELRRVSGHQEKRPARSPRLGPFATIIHVSPESVPSYDFN
jgi:hypothetical protein